MFEFTPSDRGTIASIAANTRWSMVQDRSAATAPAREKFLDRFERQVDPGGVLPAGERAKRAENAKKAYFQRLALKSAQSRRRRGGGAA